LRVPEFLTPEDDGWLSDCCINYKSSIEVTILNVELLRLELTLSCLEIGSCESLNLIMLKRAIDVIEAF